METFGGAQIIGIAWYKEADYPKVLKIMADAHVLPRNFKQWEKSAKQLEAKQRAAGRSVVRAIIDPAEFEAWCALRSHKVDANARIAFANEYAHRHGRH